MSHDAGDPEVPVVLAEGCRFQGLLTFRGAAQVDGALEGEVVTRGSLIVGKTAQIDARIEVGEVVIAGALRGQVVARRRVELLATARVTGDVRAPLVSIAEGSILQGHCRAGIEPSRPDSEPR